MMNNNIGHTPLLNKLFESHNWWMIFIEFGYIQLLFLLASILLSKKLNPMFGTQLAWSIMNWFWSSIFNGCLGICHHMVLFYSLELQQTISMDCILWYQVVSSSLLFRVTNTIWISAMSFWWWLFHKSDSKAISIEKQSIQVVEFDLSRGKHWWFFGFVVWCCILGTILNLEISIA